MLFILNEVLVYTWTIIKSTIAKKISHLSQFWIAVDENDDNDLATSSRRGKIGDKHGLYASTWVAFDQRSEN